ncbi:methionine/alanine import family NSS transporter small subunit [Nocardioides sp. TF02-7]|nr:methionine/alanine import family NSS transporter small subunit [Nocardioides sp. TF02-7]UMG94144.1 methionine/alanine import family NSS transporter small subunit [Nocardioides sp. TF02-7]
MSGAAIVMMVVAMLVIWGGLALAVVNLVRRSPKIPMSAEVHRDL